MPSPVRLIPDFLCATPVSPIAEIRQETPRHRLCRKSSDPRRSGHKSSSSPEVVGHLAVVPGILPSPPGIVPCLVYVLHLKDESSKCARPPGAQDGRRNGLGVSFRRPEPTESIRMTSRA